jgi:hypothetical protein
MVFNIRGLHFIVTKIEVMEDSGRSTNPGDGQGLASPQSYLAILTSCLEHGCFPYEKHVNISNQSYLYP